METIEYDNSVRFQSAFTKHRHDAEGDFPPSVVEQGESIPVKAMISRMMDAGVRLAESRKAYYQFQPGEAVPDDAQPMPVIESEMDAVDILNGIQPIEPPAPEAAAEEPAAAAPAPESSGE